MNKLNKILKISGWIIFIIFILFLLMKQGENKYKRKKEVEQKFYKVLEKNK